MRKQNSIKNFITSFVPFIILSVLGFVRIDVFVSMLGVEVYALNQLFFQIFAYMSLIEAGAGVLITQKYYPLLVDMDKKNINKVYSSSIALLKRISIIMMLVGMVLSFGLELLTNNHLHLGYMQLVFMLFLIRSITEYLTLSPRLVLQADQKIFKINILFSFYKVIEAIAEITLLYLGCNYVIILVSSILFRYVSYIAVNKKIFKEYTWLKKVTVNDKNIITGLKHVFAQRVAGAISDNTTILLISAFLTPLKVTIYASYNYIIKFVGDFIGIFVSAISASLGNVMYKENSKNKLAIFEELNALFFFCATFFSVAIYFAIDNFVILWLGKKMIIDNISLIIIIFVMFHNIVRKPLITVRNINGLFKETQAVALIESAIIFVMSIILIPISGIIGAMIATLVSYLTTNFWFYPNYIYKNVFETSPKKYYLTYFITLCITIAVCYITNVLNIMPPATNMAEWLLYSSIYSVIVLAMLLLGFAVFSKHFRTITIKIIDMLKHKRRGDK